MSLAYRSVGRKLPQGRHGARALRQTWAKMSPEAQAAAHGLDLSASVRGLLEEALAD
jgi:hypothetical protein